MVRRRGPSRLWTATLVVLSALAALCLVQIACRSGGATARGDSVGGGGGGGGKGDRRSIDVDGHARLDIAPDRVDLHITVTEQAKTPREAAHGVQRRRKGLLTAMKLLGLPSKRMVVSHLNLVPQYTSYRRAIEGYNASISFIVKIHDPGQLTEYVEAAAAAGASHMHTRFRNSRMQEMKRRVREMALKAAKAKAEQIASVTGVDVGQLRSVREGAHSNWMGQRWGWGAANPMANSTSSVQAPFAGPTRPDAIRLHLTVAVSYAIR